MGNEPWTDGYLQGNFFLDRKMMKDRTSKYVTSLSIIKQNVELQIYTFVHPHLTKENIKTREKETFQKFTFISCIPSIIH